MVRAVKITKTKYKRDVKQNTNHKMYTKTVNAKNKVKYLSECLKASSKSEGVYKSRGIHMIGVALRKWMNIMLQSALDLLF